MNDKLLADRVVALGVGSTHGCLYSHILKPVFEQLAPAGMFIRDWRVAGTLMEKYGRFIKIDSMGDQEWIVACCRPGSREHIGHILPRTIVEACVEELDLVQTGLTHDE